ncbi:hypothetical protein [Paenibacillus nasutitermitis]|uniref:Uncharacterized protein n=1 Tax=Paenibacillus nasutitermitis TaxID=1652958 RepID=A0A916YVI8_9BACL|nr:hypothetical protein [Paenibacillus nasutitermitis]GGD63736.1 hypothetical protein GCM10010911_21870 [Paenibacillus nasutitermitis]
MKKRAHKEHADSPFMQAEIVMFLTHGDTPSGRREERNLLFQPADPFTLYALLRVKVLPKHRSSSSVQR